MDTTWLTFLTTAAAAVFCLYVPGYLVLFGAGFSHLRSLLFAPLVTVVAYQSLALLWDTLHVVSSPATVLTPPLGVGAFLTIIRLMQSRTRKTASPSQQDESTTRAPWGVLIAYIAAGMTVGSITFLSAMGNPDAFHQGVDASTHLRLLQSFVQSGRWSPFGPNGYQTALDASIAPLSDAGGFYPVAWHVVASLSLELARSTPTITTNALGFVVGAVVFPASMYMLLQVLEDKPGNMVYYGAVFSSVFAAFPWIFMAFGPLYPNLLANALLPLCLASFMIAIKLVLGRRSALRYVLLFVLSACALVLSQPNAIFTVGVFLAPFCVWALGARNTAQHEQATAQHAKQRQKLYPWLRQAVFVVLAALVWIALYKAPQLQVVIHGYLWPASTTLPEALQQILMVAYNHPPQWILALLVLAGFVFTLRIPNLRWLPFTFLAFGVIYAWGMGTDGFLKRFLAGFWYADPFRISANMIYSAIPLACAGAAGIAQTITRIVGKSDTAQSGSPAVSLVVAFILGAAIALPSFVSMPSISDSALHDVHARTAWEYSATGNVYDADERAFVNQVKQTIGSETLIYNNPDDGSVFAYGADGLRVKYRTFSYNFRTDPKSESNDSRIVRTELNQISADKDVAQAARTSGAEYVLLLDVDDHINQQRHFNDWLNPDAFAGIQGVSDITPGFSIVLSEGDMRLYHIDAEAQEIA